MIDTPKYRQPQSWDQTFMDIARAIAKRSKDPSTQAGAVIVDNRNRILGSGFNGPPPQINDDKVPWDQRPQKYGYVLHAEENAILDALSKSKSEVLLNSTLYCTHMPCSECTLLIIAMNIATVIYDMDSNAHQVNNFTLVHPTDILAAQKMCYFSKKPTEFLMRKFQ